jgi:hypothetical protein
MTAASSFAKAKFWLEELRATEEQCRVYLVGCKADLLVRTERAVPQETVRAYAQQVGAKVFETSALTGQGVQEVRLEALPVCAHARVWECVCACSRACTW